MRNALTHTPAGTPIELSLSGSTAGVAIEVRDHGPGLGGHADSVFERLGFGAPARARAHADDGEPWLWMCASARHWNLDRADPR